MRLHSYSGLDKHKFSASNFKSFLPIILACVVGAQKNRLTETALLSTQHMFWLRNKTNDFPVRTLIWPGFIIPLH